MTQICDSVNIPTYPSSDTCVITGTNDRTIYNSRETSLQLQQNHLDKFEAEFNSLINDNSSNNYDKHQKINCLLNSLLGNIKTNYENYNLGIDNIQNQLNSEKRHLEEQLNVLKTNENSDLVTKYRDENSKKRNKQMSTQFTIYVTMIVIFLIVEGIVFFV